MVMSAGQTRAIRWAEMDISETISVVIMALTLSFLATIFPAWRASKLDPVQALRYE
jgi:lipoprotein-releasing system permease protein